MPTCSSKPKLLTPYRPENQKGRIGLRVKYPPAKAGGYYS
jgi:hypothetical protein